MLQIKTQTWVLCIPGMVTQVEELPFCFENGYALLSFLPRQKATAYLKLLKCLSAPCRRWSPVPGVSGGWRGGLAWRLG